MAASGLIDRKMNTPICDFIDEYANSGALRLHMPGHKGKNFVGVEEKDITEIAGADVLSFPQGIIAESEKNASKLFGSEKTLYSTGGCTEAIKMMLYLACMHAKANGKKPFILAARNAHKAFVSAACEIGFDFGWIDAEGEVVAQDVTQDVLERAVRLSKTPPTAVYVTSPDYLGNLLDVASLKKVCSSCGALLLVDNAHGAYLRFAKGFLHPLSAGADMCADSAHKTLPVLTGGAYLHINSAVYRVIGGFIEIARSTFCSTSPSYLTLYSLDKSNSYLADGYEEKLSASLDLVSRAKAELAKSGYRVVGNEPAKITLAPKDRGYTGEDLASVLRKNGIEAEFADKDYLVLMITPQNDEAELKKTLNVLLGIKNRESIKTLPPRSHLPKRALHPRDALFSLSETLPTERATGRIFASCSLSCPPAVPILVAGEVVDEKAVRSLRYYGIEKIKVLL